MDVEITGPNDAVRTAHTSGPVVKQSHKQFQPIDPDWLVRFDEAYKREAQDWVQFMRNPGFTNLFSFPPFYCWEQEVTPALNILM